MINHYFVYRVSHLLNFKSIHKKLTENLINYSLNIESDWIVKPLSQRENHNKYFVMQSSDEFLFRKIDLNRIFCDIDKCLINSWTFFDTIFIFIFIKSEVKDKKIFFYWKAINGLKHFYKLIVRMNDKKKWNSFNHNWFHYQTNLT